MTTIAERPTMDPVNKREDSEFRFASRTERLRWDYLLSIDIDDVSDRVDLETLQNIARNITYSKLTLKDLKNHDQEDFAHLFQLSQLINEYLLFIQHFLATKRVNLEENASHLIYDLDKYQRGYEKKNKEVKKLKADINRYKRTIFAYQLVFGVNPEKLKEMMEEMNQKGTVEKPPTPPTPAAQPTPPTPRDPTQNAMSDELKENLNKIERAVETQQQEITNAQRKQEKDMDNMKENLKNQQMELIEYMELKLNSVIEQIAQTQASQKKSEDLLRASQDMMKLKNHVAQQKITIEKKIDPKLKADKPMKKKKKPQPKPVVKVPVVQEPIVKKKQTKKTLEQRLVESIKSDIRTGYDAPYSEECEQRVPGNKQVTSHYRQSIEHLQIQKRIVNDRFARYMSSLGIGPNSTKLNKVQRNQALRAVKLDRNRYNNHEEMENMVDEMKNIVDDIAANYQSLPSHPQTPRTHEFSANRKRPSVSSVISSDVELDQAIFEKVRNQKKYEHELRAATARQQQMKNFNNLVKMQKKEHEEHDRETPDRAAKRKQALRDRIRAQMANKQISEPKMQQDINVSNQMVDGNEVSSDSAVETKEKLSSDESPQEPLVQNDPESESEEYNHQVETEERDLSDHNIHVDDDDEEEEEENLNEELSLIEEEEENVEEEEGEEEKEEEKEQEKEEEKEEDEFEEFESEQEVEEEDEYKEFESKPIENGKTEIVMGISAGEESETGTEGRSGDEMVGEKTTTQPTIIKPSSGTAIMAMSPITSGDENDSIQIVNNTETDPDEFSDHQITAKKRVSESSVLFQSMTEEESDVNTTEPETKPSRPEVSEDDDDESIEEFGSRKKEKKESEFFIKPSRKQKRKSPSLKKKTLDFIEKSDHENPMQLDVAMENDLDAMLAGLKNSGQGVQSPLSPQKNKNQDALTRMILNKPELPKRTSSRSYSPVKIKPRTPPRPSSQLAKANAFRNMNEEDEETEEKDHLDEEEIDEEIDPDVMDAHLKELLEDDDEFSGSPIPIMNPKKRPSEDLDLIEALDNSALDDDTDIPILSATDNTHPLKRHSLHLSEKSDFSIDLDDTDL